MQAALATLDTACEGLAGGAFRIRFALAKDGVFSVQCGALAALSQPVKVFLADDATQAADLFLRHKTSIRTRYDAAWREAEARGGFDSLFFNQHGELAEGGRSNVFARVDGRWCTPPLSCGLLPGVMRSVVLADPQWNAVERVITREMLARADDIMVCNSLRGTMTAEIEFA
jgi:para-aminobenzoate synthetase/4-amino-4-deoxychorismate lyase